MKRSLFFTTLLLAPLAFAFASPDDQSIVKVRENIFIGANDTVQEAVVLMGSARVDGRVRDNVVSVLGNITLGPKAVIEGDVVSVGGRIIRKKGSRIGGKEAALAFPLKDAEKVFLLAVPVVASIVAVAVGLTALFSGIGFVALIILVLTMFDKQVAKAQQKIRNQPWRTLLLGLAGFCCIVPVLVFLVMTVIGIPLAFLGAAVAVAALVLGVVAVGQWAGTEVAKKLGWKLKPIWIGLLGVTLIFVTSLIPVVGTLVQFFTMFFGLGAVIQTRFRQ